MQFLSRAVVLFLATGGVALAAEPLNVLFIMADDLGWSDTTLYGTTALHETPNIERLTERGMMIGQTPARNGATAPQHHTVDVWFEAAESAAAPPATPGVGRCHRGNAFLSPEWRLGRRWRKATHSDLPAKTAMEGNHRLSKEVTEGGRKGRR